RDSGFDMSGFRYHSFYVNTMIGPVNGMCGVEGPAPVIYVYGSHCDMDGDGKPHGLMLSAGVNADHDLYKNGGIFTIPSGAQIYGATWELEYQTKPLTDRYKTSPDEVSHPW